MDIQIPVHFSDETKRAILAKNFHDKVNELNQLLDEMVKLGLDINVNVNRASCSMKDGVRIIPPKKEITLDINVFEIVYH